MEEIEKILYYSNIRKKFKKSLFKTLDNMKNLLYDDFVLSDKGQKKEPLNPRKVEAILKSLQDVKAKIFYFFRPCFYILSKKIY